MKKEFHKPMLCVVSIDAKTVLCTSGPTPEEQPQVEFIEGSAIWDSPVL